MDDKTLLIITLAKEIADVAEGRALTDIVKNKLADQPTVKITSNCTTRFDVVPEP